LPPFEKSSINFINRTNTMDVESLEPMTSSPISLEAIKFHLIWNKDFSFTRENQTVSLEELIEFLIESLEDADKATATKAENLLTRIGRPAIPYLIQGLKSSHNRVKSVCAMVLIRIGAPAVEDLKEFYVRNASRPTSRQKIRWVVEFILNELGSQVPELDVQEIEAGRNVLQFSKAV
jgi:HEAT repeat protein